MLIDSILQSIVILIVNHRADYRVLGIEQHAVSGHLCTWTCEQPCLDISA